MQSENFAAAVRKQVTYRQLVRVDSAGVRDSTEPRDGLELLRVNQEAFLVDNVLVHVEVADSAQHDRARPLLVVVDDVVVMDCSFAMLQSV